MGLSVSPQSRAPWYALVLLTCAAVGLTAGVEPKAALEVAMGLAFVVAVLSSPMLGLCLVTFLSFLEVLNVGGAALSLAKVAGFLLFASWVASSSNHERAGEVRALFIDQPALCWFTIAFVGWSAISVTWASSSSVAFSSTERFLLDAMLLPIVYGIVSSRRRLLWLLGTLLAGAAVSAAYGFPSLTSGRLAGSIGDPNEEAAVLVAALALAVGLFYCARRASIGRVLIALGIALSLLGVFTTLSRGALVAGGCTLVSGVVLGGRWRRHALVVLGLTVALTGFYFAAIASVTAEQRVTSSGTSGRQDLWKVGLVMFRANPILGVGSDNFQTVEADYIQRTRGIRRADLIVTVPHVSHNSYLETLDDLGIPGLMLLLGILGSSLRAGFQAAHRYQRSGDRALELLSRMTLLAILALLAADFFIVGEYSKQLWLMLAIPPVLLSLPDSVGVSDAEPA